MNRRFVHLHLHSEYSLLDGACRIKDIPKKVKEMGHDAVAITDHGVMYGVADFYKACKKEGIKPIIGCEVYVAVRSMYDKDRNLDYQSNHLVLLVKNEVGYHNLLYLVSKAFTDGFYSKPRIDIELLKGHTEGLIALSACLAGFIPRAITAGDYEGAQKHALLLNDLFGDGNFYLEIQNHGLADQDIVNKAIQKISLQTGIGMVATNDVHYLNKEDSDAQAILMCIQTNNVITDGKPVGFETDEFYYKSTEQMEELFSEYEGAVDNTAKIADICSFELEFGKTYLPRYAPENGMDPSEFLKTLAYEGIKRRTGAGHIIFDDKNTEEVYNNRINYELGIIHDMGYDEYYLIVWDFVNHAKNKGIPVGPGRGSGAGSLVAYLIGITDVDPMKFDLLFERFLNPERVSMPDFDIDFCYYRRDEVIDYVKTKYGADRAVQIITFGTMAARAAVRDVGRALGMPYGEVDKVAREIPHDLKMTLDKALESNKNLKAMYDSDYDVKRLLDTAKLLEGMPRHASTHAAGVVITDKPVTEYVPVAVNGGTVVTQFGMDTIAELGLLKFDFLALRYLTIIDNAEKLVREKDRSFDLNLVDMSDKETYDTISAGRTDGVFQLESQGMRQMLTQMKPACIDDIIASIALYRPGPMDSIPKYIEARNDPSKVHYRIPQLSQILESTHGCIVYQEQVMQIFREIAGYSYGHADIVRRAISKKKSDVLNSEHDAFIKGALERGVKENDAADLFDDIVSFANYAFNKSHAAAYAVLSFRTAYLKTHYPLEYLCALLTSVLGSSGKISEYMSEAAKLGIKVLPPDINHSKSGFCVEGNNIRYGLSALKNVGEQFISSIVDEREINGKYQDIDDFLARTKDMNMNKKQLEALIKSGALDSLGVKRSQLLAVYDTLLDLKSSKVPEGQLDMFSVSKPSSVKMPKISFPDIPEFSVREKLYLEKESSGLYLSGHMLDDYSKSIEALNPSKIADINAAFDDASDYTEENIQSEPLFRDRQRVTVAGIITKRTNKAMRSGETMSFVTIEDKTGDIEMICFPSQLEEYGYLLVFDGAVSVTGSLSIKDDADVKIIVNSVKPLLTDDQIKKADNQNVISPKDGDAVMKSYKKLFLRVPSVEDEKFKKVQAFIQIFEGSTPVIFYDSSEQKYIKDLIMTVNATDFTLEELKEILGDGNVVPL